MQLKLLGDLRTLSLIITTSIALTGCMGSKELEPSGQSSSVRIPLEQEGQLKMGAARLESIRDYKTLSGETVDFVLYPKMAQGRLTGEVPQFHFTKNSKGEYVAMNDISLQAAMVAYHFQEFRKMDESLGLAGILSYPRKIGWVLDNQQYFVNNAYYDSTLDAFIFVPFMKADLPLMANSGVLAHEHFHALFGKTVGLAAKEKFAISTDDFLNPHLLAETREISEKIPDGFHVGIPEEKLKEVENLELSTEDRNLYHSMLIRGINEGLADVWAWIYTGNPDFLALSMPKEKEGRTLEKPLDQELEFYSVERLKLDILDTKEERKDVRAVYLNRVAYSYGTQLARHLKVEAGRLKIEKSLGEKESRLLLANALVKSLPELKASIEKLGEKDFLSTTTSFELIKKNLELP